MKKSNLFKAGAIIFIALSVLLKVSGLKAQNDVLDLCTQAEINCNTTPSISIGVDIDGTGGDTVVILDNISGYRLLNIVPADKQYLFAANNGLVPLGCSDEGIGGEFRIKFEYPSGTKIGVNNISFEITDRSDAVVTVSPYQGGIIGGFTQIGNTYICCDNSTPYDSIVITSTHVATLNTVDELFILDNLFINIPIVSFVAPTDVCINAGLQLLSGTPGGGVFSGTGVSGTNFDPATAGVGTHTITYTYTDANGCINSANDDIEVFALPTPSFTAPADVCLNAGLQALSGTPSGGVFSGTGVSVTNFDPSLAGVGIHTITYTYTDANGCNNSASDDIEVFALPTPGFTAPADVCLNAGLQGLSGTPTGGVFSGTGVSGTNFDPATAGAGIHTITYTYTDVNGCGNSASDDIEVFALPVPGFTAEVTSACVGSTGNTYTTQAGMSNYVWNVSGGGAITAGGTSTDDFVTVTWNTSGPQTVTVNYTDGNGCTATSFATSNITVYMLPTPSFTAEVTSACVGSGFNGDVYTTQAGMSNYVWNVSGGGAIIGGGTSTDNSVTVRWNTSGAQTVTVNYTDANGCSAASSVISNVTVSACPPEVVCVIDLSGSMRRDFYGTYGMPQNNWRISYAKVALKAFTDLLNSNFENDANFGLASFKRFSGGSCEANKDYDINIINTANLGTITPIIDGLSASGGTNLLAGLDTAKNMLLSNDVNNKKVIILLSDGAHNCPSTISDILSDVNYTGLMDELEDKIRVYTIAFGQSGEVDLGLLASIASDTYGQFYDLTLDADPDKTALDPSVTDADTWYSGGVWAPNNALSIAYTDVLTDGLDLSYTDDPMGVIDQGVTRKFDIPVSGFESKITFFVSWVTPQSNYLGIKVKTSNGNELPTNHSDISYIHRDNYSIITVSGNYLNHFGIVNSNPWKLEIDALNINSESEKFQYLVLNKSNKLKFKTWFDKKWYYTGDIMKIHLELLEENRHLSELNKVLIKGSMPEEGLGNWLNKEKISKQRLVERRKYEIKRIKDYTQKEANKLRLDKVQNQKLLEKNISMLEDMSSIRLKTQIMTQEMKIKYPGRVIVDGLLFNDEGKNGDETARDGIYTAEYKNLTKEGTYKFNITAIDTGRGKNIKRESQLQKYVRVRIKPNRFIKELIRVDTLIKGQSVYKAILSLKDAYGNVPHPNDVKNIELSMANGNLIGHIQANPDGSFEQLISLPENISPRKIKMSMKVYDQIGEQRLKALIPKWIYAIIGVIILIAIGLLKRKK